MRIGGGADLVQSLVPGCLLFAAIPMHIMWFIGGLKGHLYRRSKNHVKETRIADKTGFNLTNVLCEPKSSTPGDLDDRTLASLLCNDRLCEQTSKSRLSEMTSYSPCSDLSPSLASTSPGDSPLLTPHSERSRADSSNETLARPPAISHLLHRTMQ